jgi:hypothetical protein
LHQNTLASSNPKLIKILMHQNASHIYVCVWGGGGGGGGERTSVWPAWWGGGGEPCVAAAEKEVGVEAAA